jgi:hypothetical protein
MQADSKVNVARLNGEPAPACSLLIRDAFVRPFVIVVVQPKYVQQNAGGQSLVVFRTSWCFVGILGEGRLKCGGRSRFCVTTNILSVWEQQNLACMPHYSLMPTT